MPLLKLRNNCTRADLGIWDYTPTFSLTHTISSIEQVANGYFLVILSFKKFPSPPLQVVCVNLSVRCQKSGSLRVWGYLSSSAQRVLMFQGSCRSHSSSLGVRVPSPPPTTRTTLVRILAFFPVSCPFFYSPLPVTPHSQLFQLQWSLSLIDSICCVYSLHRQYPWHSQSARLFDISLSTLQPALVSASWFLSGFWSRIHWISASTYPFASHQEKLWVSWCILVFDPGLFFGVRFLPLPCRTSVNLSIYRDSDSVWTVWLFGLGFFDSLACLCRISGLWYLGIILTLSLFACMLGYRIWLLCFWITACTRRGLNSGQPGLRLSVLSFPSFN